MFKGDNMFGLIRDVFDFSAKVVGTAVGVATFPIALALGVSEHLVKRAVEAGCKTQEEIKEWIENNS